MVKLFIMLSPKKVVVPDACYWTSKGFFFINTFVYTVIIALLDIPERKTTQNEGGLEVSQKSARVIPSMFRISNSSAIDSRRVRVVGGARPVLAAALSVTKLGSVTDDIDFYV